LQGLHFVHIGSISGRHTAIVSTDHAGLAFYYGLGKALFFEASDVLQILGKYSNEEHILPGQPPVHQRHARRTNTILVMAPLTPGTAPHPTDAYNGPSSWSLEPLPKTWYRRHRNEDDEQIGRAKFCATLA
jgi:hypothetical protein